MKKILFSLNLIFVLVPGLFMLTGCSGNNKQSAAENLPPPHILWITTEDISPFLGCYGYKNATTPNLDKLASEGVLYSHAFANVAVCAPARSTLITGMYASSLGTHNMRSKYSIPEEFKTYPEYLMEAGYYCTNAVKTDYNISNIRDIWDENTKEAHYKNRAAGQPFFAIFNLTMTHEGQIFHYDPKDLIHDPASMELPPYHPDLPELRNDWAKFYDNITKMDTRVGELLAELEATGLADSTIVFFYGDHGGILPRSKRYIYNSGTRVPFIIRFPEAYKHLAPSDPGTKSDRLVAFVDLASTLLSLADIPKPENMQGAPFLGKYKEDEPETVYFFRNRMDGRYDMMRAICDHQYRYMVNYMAHRPYGQNLRYLWQAAGVRAWEKAYYEGKCNDVQRIFWEPKPAEELYDMNADPWEVNNLATDPEYEDILVSMRKKMQEEIIEKIDAGFNPEGELFRMDEAGSIYEAVRADNYPMKEIVRTASLRAENPSDLMVQLVASLHNRNVAVRYQAALGLASMREDARPAVAALEKGLKDASSDVRVICAEALYQCGITEPALETLKAALTAGNIREQLLAADVFIQLGKAAVSNAEAELRAADEATEDRYIKDNIAAALNHLKN